MINLLTPPIFDDEDKTLVAHHLFIIVWTFMAVGWLAIFIAVIIPETVYRWLLVVGVIESAGLILLALNQYGHIRLASNLLIFIVWAAATGMALTGGGTSSNAMALYFIIVFIAGLVLSGKAGIITAVLCSLTGLFLVYLEYNGALPVNQVPHTPLTQWIANTIYMAIIISLQYLVSRTIRNALKQSRQDLKARQRVDAALWESEDRYRTILESTGDGILAVDNAGRVIQTNQRFADLWKIPSNLFEKESNEAFPTYVLGQLVDPDTFLEKIHELHASTAVDFDTILFKDGRIIERYSCPLLSEGVTNGRVWSFRDITERKRAEQEIDILADIGRIINSTLDIDEVYERFAETVRKIVPFDRIVINIIDVEMSTVTNVYLAGHGVTDRNVGVIYPLEGSGNFEMVCTKSTLLIQTEDFDEYKDRFPRLLSTFQSGFRSIMNIPLFSKGEIVGGLLLRSFKPYAYTDYDVRLAERVGNQIAGAIANAQLFAKLKKTEQELKENEQRYRKLSIVDDLTQLYNFRHFYFQLKIELDRSNRYEQPLTLLLIDLDNFKTFNDTYGHVEGDQVLQRLGQVVKRCLRETDFAYRYGGEEFTILLPMTTSADGAVTAERIRTEFKKETFSPVPGQEVHVTVSIGLAQYKPQEEMKVFVHRVDQLMYQGKKNGKDRVCSEP